MHQFRKSALFFASILVSATVAAQDLQIKGKRLGMTEVQACDGGAIKSLSANIEEAGVKGLVFPATACDVIISSLGSLGIDSPAHLLFWEGAMIRMVIKIDQLDMKAVADIRSALIGLHGNPKTQRNKPFFTDRWHRKGQILEAEWVRYGGEAHGGGLYLTDPQGYGKYEASSAKAMKLIEAMRRERIKSNILD